MDDEVKEGNRLSLLRLNTNDSVVRVDETQSLFIETSNDGQFENDAVFCSVVNK